MIKLSLKKWMHRLAISRLQCGVSISGFLSFRRPSTTWLLVSLVQRSSVDRLPRDSEEDIGCPLGMHLTGLSSWPTKGFKDVWVPCWQRRQDFPISGVQSPPRLINLVNLKTRIMAWKRAGKILRGHATFNIFPTAPFYRWSNWVHVIVNGLPKVT